MCADVRLCDVLRQVGQHQLYRYRQSVFSKIISSLTEFDKVLSLWYISFFEIILLNNPPPIRFLDFLPQSLVEQI